MSAVPELRHHKFSGNAIITPMCFVLTRTSQFASRSKIRPRQGLVEISREVSQPKVDTTHLALLSIYKHPYHLVLATPTAMQHQNTQCAPIL